MSLTTSLSLLLTLGSLSARAADAGTGSIAGTVTSTSTRNALQGATVRIPALNRTEYTDSSGSYLLQNLPAGPVEIVTSYVGFGDERTSVSVRPGETTRVETAMKPSESVLVMEAFTVATQKEGQALSITEQRNALNVKNVVAFDEWGILPTQNVGELASRLPGVAVGQQDEDDLIMNVSIGGQPASYTRLNIDGMSSTGVGGDGRTATLHSFSGSMYEQIEIIAGQTPDKRADSLGGQLNLKTRSPMAMSEKRRITYNAGMRFFPSWSERNFAVSGRRPRPDLSVGYTERFDVGDGHRNLGVAFTAAYQEVLNPHNFDTLLYENTTAPNAQLRDYTKQTGLNDRFISAFSGRVDYRVSPSTTASLRFLYNAGSEPFFHYTAMNPWASANLTVYDPISNPNGSILPGYTANRIEFRPTSTVTAGNTVGAAQMRINPQRYSFTSKNPTGTLVFEHNWGRLKLDHAYRWSNTHWDSGAGRHREDGTLALRTKDPIGFVLDQSNLDGQVFTWTGGADPYDIRSYTPFVTGAASATQPVPTTSSAFVKRDTITDTNEVAANVNLTYALDLRLPVTFKTGLDTVNRRVNSRAVYPRRWYQIPGTVLPTAGLMPMTEFEIQNGNRRMPVLDPAYISTTLNDTSLWYEDVNYTATQRYTGRYIFEEGVDAAYVQGSTKVGQLTILGGVRGEWVSTETFTYFRARTTPIAAEPDHFKRAAMDYAEQSRDGSYHKWFPSLHLSYDITRNFKARASWSTSYGRPTRQQLVPTPSISETNRTVTIGNTSLKPQLANNLDLKLEYYLTSGAYSVRGYRKHIKDYIAAAGRSGQLVGKGPDNGFDGLYEDFEIIQSSNVGDATYNGIEFDFRQRLTFLPSYLKGLTARGNFTYLEAKGKFAGTTELHTGEIVDFIPRTGNFGLIYNYKKFGVSFDLNHRARTPVAYTTSPTNPNGIIMRKPITTLNAGLTYQFRPFATFFLNVNNITEQGQQRYTFTENRHRSEWVVPRAVKLGVTGQF